MTDRELGSGPTPRAGKDSVVERTHYITSVLSLVVLSSRCGGYHSKMEGEGMEGVGRREREREESKVGGIGRKRGE